MNIHAKKLIHFTMAVVAMGLLASTGSMAGSTSTMPSFTSMDINQDGTLSAQEYDVMIAGFDQYKDPIRLSFKNMDTNHDGAMSKGEYDVMIAGFDQYKDPGRVSFESMDTDHDGMMSRSEYNAMIAGFDQYKTR